MDFAWRWQTACQGCPAGRLHLSWGFMTSLSDLSITWRIKERGEKIGK